MKYIIFEAPDGMGMETIRVFDEITSHSEVMAEVHAYKPGLKVVSAGILRLTIKDNGMPAPYCVAKSVTLGIPFSSERSEKDTEIAERMFHFSA